MFFNKKKLADLISPGCILINKKLNIRATVLCRKDAPLCYTWIVENDYFNLEIRDKQIFNNLFRGWKVLKSGCVEKEVPVERVLKGKYD